MSLARIITRSPDDAHAIHQYLVDRGYRVEFADPSALNLEPADLEIDLQRLPLDEGLRLASEWAENAGSDVYVAAGALATQVESEPEDVRPAENVRPAEVSSYVPPTSSQPEVPPPAEAPPARSEVVRETFVQAAGIVSDSLGETKDAVSQSFSDLKQRFVPAREVRAVEPSKLERWRQALADRRVARKENKARELEAARLAREERARREALAVTFARDLREQRAREAAAKPEMVASVAPTAHPARTSVQAAAERRVSLPRRDFHKPDDGAEYWRGAFTGAAVVAVILMVAWATLGTSHPPASGGASGQVKQDVPFGPVTLTPSAAPARRATAVPQADSAQAARAVTPAPKPAPVRSRRTHRAAANSGIADDEVVVHHYGASKAAPSKANTTAKNSGPKRISDQ